MLAPIRTNGRSTESQRASNVRPETESWRLVATGQGSYFIILFRIVVCKGNGPTQIVTPDWKQGGGRRREGGVDDVTQFRVRALLSRSICATIGSDSPARPPDGNTIRIMSAFMFLSSRQYRSLFLFSMNRQNFRPGMCDVSIRLRKGLMTCNGGVEN